jgi:acetyl-CoA carboxylase biotin carboxyl carrier protein
VELDQIKELMASVESSKIRKLLLKKGDFELQIEKEGDHIPVAAHAAHSSRAMFAPESSGEPIFHSEHVSKGDRGGKPRSSEVLGDGQFVTSPMVGTFYAAPATDQPAFVKVGDMVEENTVVCIVEAMKVMNEVKANVRGTVAEVLVENAHPVEFGSRILRII